MNNSFRAILFVLFCSLCSFSSICKKEKDKITYTFEKDTIQSLFQKDSQGHNFALLKRLGPTTHHCSSVFQPADVMIVN